MLYVVCRFILRFLYRILFRLEAIGLEHVPASGAMILASNHVSNLDPPTVGILLRRKLHFMAKIELFKVPLLGSLIRSLGAFPVNRGGVSKDAIKASIALLKEEKTLAIFPEGSRGGGAGKKGMALIAHRSGAVIVPTAIVGRYRLFGKTKVVYGAPIDPKAIIDPSSEDPLEQLTETVMTRIRELTAQHQ